MQICQDHWTRLRAAIDARGMSHLVAQFAEALAERITEGVDPDPLMVCHIMIMQKAIEAGGFYLLGAKEDGSPYCPICEAIAYRPDDVTLERCEEFWIDGSANAVLEVFREKGLVPGVQ